jgi:hypothetical protein
MMIVQSKSRASWPLPHPAGAGQSCSVINGDNDTAGWQWPAIGEARIWL